MPIAGCPLLRFYYSADHLEVASIYTMPSCEQHISTGVTASTLDEFVVVVIANLPIRIDDQTAQQGLARTLSLARTQRLTAYDAAYLELALREACPLATLDVTLSRAAEQLGIAAFLV